MRQKCGIPGKKSEKEMTGDRIILSILTPLTLLKMPWYWMNYNQRNSDSFFLSEIQVLSAIQTTLTDTNLDFMELTVNLKRDAGSNRQQKVIRVSIGTVKYIRKRKVGKGELVEQQRDSLFSK